MALDPRTLLWLGCFCSGLGALLVWGYGRRVSDALGTVPWALANLAVGTQFGLLATREALPLELGVTLPNLLAIAACALFHLGACRLRGRRFPWARHALLFAVAGLLIELRLLELDAHFRVRVVLGAGVTGAQLLMTGVTLGRQGDLSQGDELRTLRLGAGAFLTFGVLQLLRAALHLPGVPLGADSLYARGFMASLVGLLLFAYTIVGPFTLIFIHDTRSRLRLREGLAALEEALSHVKKLSGLLPMCACCKSIRDDRGYWRQLERYFREHSEVRFSHGLCPTCLERLYPDLADEAPADSVESVPPAVVGARANGS